MELGELLQWGGALPLHSELWFLQGLQVPMWLCPLALQDKDSPPCGSSALSPRMNSLSSSPSMSLPP